MTDPVRIFIGAAPNGADAECQAVCEYTLRKHASRDIEITWMILSRDPASPFYSDPPKGWQTALWPTPFSGFRWAVPQLCNFKGKAIYMDDDMIVLDDIAKLWDQPFQQGKAVIAKGHGRLCVSLWDCAAMRYRDHYPLGSLQLAEGHSRARAVMSRQSEIVQPFVGDWNCLDGEKYARIDDPNIKIIHMTSMPHQPAVPHAIKRLAATGRTHWFDGTIKAHFRSEITKLFDQLLVEAEANGFPVSRYDDGGAFGDYRKGVLKSLTGAKPSWA